MCIDCDVDCDVARRPDITLSLTIDPVRRIWDHSFIPHSAAANAFLARKFAQVEGDLTLRDVKRIVAQARALGFVVVEG